MRTILHSRVFAPAPAMQKGKGRGWISFSLWLLLSGFLFSCITDDLSLTPVSPPIGKLEKEIIFQMSVPYASAPKPQSRAIGDKEENTIQTLMVLAFRVENNKETYDYSSVGQKSGSPEGAVSQKFSVVVKLKEYPHRCVVITNAENEIAVLIGHSAWVGIEKNVMLPYLEMALSQAGDQWNTISASNYTAFPMWGESAPEVITNTTSGLSN
ncbi:MAG: hypothetical protein LBC40_03820, partial [Dysgonamonadaceae bacterium]|nr:hypothetical protein [Dysgonamonadaceae bacterium]